MYHIFRYVCFAYAVRQAETHKPKKRSARQAMSVIVSINGQRFLLDYMRFFMYNGVKKAKKPAKNGKER